MHVFIHAISYLTPNRSMNMIWFLKVLLTSRSICLISVEYFLACSFIVCNNIKTKMIRNNAYVINNFEFCRHYRLLLIKWTGKKTSFRQFNSDIFKKISQTMSICHWSVKQSYLPNSCHWLIQKTWQNRTAQVYFWSINVHPVLWKSMNKWLTNGYLCILNW